MAIRDEASPASRKRFAKTMDGGPAEWAVDGALGSDGGVGGVGVWIFGYGSLIWRPSFPFVERRWGYLPGWARRFYQGSTDHRGTEQSPGRVVTLLPEPDNVVWGIAYRIKDDDRDRVLSYLGVREQNGYDVRSLDVVLREGDRTVQALVYLATPGNVHYLGPAPLEDMALQISGAHGPSGANAEYLLELAAHLTEIGVHDEHVHELADRVRIHQRTRMPFYDPLRLPLFHRTSTN
ncbi:glutathione-specific gamma-glutamylcyclotransferase [Plasmodiophora brassicae]|nr:hypothetical protein PBRA_007251 [Plasmodiophora brassicae]